MGTKRQIESENAVIAMDALVDLFATVKPLRALSQLDVVLLSIRDEFIDRSAHGGKFSGLYEEYAHKLHNLTLYIVRDVEKAMDE